MTVAFVQSKSASTGSPGTTLAVTLTSSVTSGNALIAGAFDGSGINKTITYTDNVNAGNFPNSDKNQNLATDGDTCNVSSRQNCAAGSTTVTAHGGSITGLIVHEVSGLPTAAGSMVDQSASANPTSATPSSGNTAATTNATDYVFGFIGTSGSADTVTHGTGYTARETNALGHVASEDLVTSVTGVQAATFNVSPSDECAVFCIAYLSASAGGATGSAAITEGADTTAETGSIGVSGSAGITEGADTVAGTGSVGVSGSAGITEGADAVSASGSATIGAAGSAGITEDPDIVSAAGSVGVSGSAGILEDADIVLAQGSVPTPVGFSNDPGLGGSGGDRWSSQFEFSRRKRSTEEEPLETPSAPVPHGTLPISPQIDENVATQLKNALQLPPSEEEDDEEAFSMLLQAEDAIRTVAVQQLQALMGRLKQ